MLSINKHDQWFFMWPFLLLLLSLFLASCSPAAANSPSGLAVPTPEQRLVRLSTTTSVYDSGLLQQLKAAFESGTGYHLEIVANGTGAALKLGESGDADVLLVHAREAEEVFIAAGHGLERLPFMHNFFVIAGPIDDPARIAGSRQATEAFFLIANAGMTFISRGDDSGTHKAELKIWSAAGIEPTGEWYHAVGKGMGASLIMANEKQAYILTDEAAFLATAGLDGLRLHLEATDDLKNTYALIAVNSDKHPAINTNGASAWIDFIFSAEAADIISSFGKEAYGKPLFIYDGRSS